MHFPQSEFRNLCENTGDGPGTGTGTGDRSTVGPNQQPLRGGIGVRVGNPRTVGPNQRRPRVTIFCHPRVPPLFSPGAGTRPFPQSGTYEHQGSYSVRPPTLLVVARVLFPSVHS